jgi:hypothetical protein
VVPRVVTAYGFSSVVDTGVSAFTTDPTGANLPANLAPWRPINGGRAMGLGSPLDPFVMRVNRDGYSLIRPSH